MGSIAEVHCRLLFFLNEQLLMMQQSDIIIFLKSDDIKDSQA